jgi:hypothetical protein
MEAAALALLEAITAQFAPNPLVHALEFKPNAASGSRSHPTRNKLSSTMTCAKTHAPRPAGNLPDLLLGAIYAFGRDPEFAVQKQPMAEELAFPDRSDGALFTVHPELEFLFQKPGHRFHHSLPRRQRPHVDVAVVGIAAEAMAPAFQ